MSQSGPEQSALDAMTSGDPDEPVWMLNLLRYREQAIAPIRAAALADSRLIESSQLLPKIEP